MGCICTSDILSCSFFFFDASKRILHQCRAISLDNVGIISHDKADRYYATYMTRSVVVVVFQVPRAVFATYGICVGVALALTLPLLLIVLAAQHVQM